MNKIKLKKAHVITDRNKIQKLVKMTNGIIGIETLKIELYKKGDDMTREPEWFKKFRIENDKHWEENNKRWEANDKCWEENNKRWEKNDKRWEDNNRKWEENSALWKKQLDFNNQVTKFMQTITNLPTIKKELKNGK